MLKALTKKLWASCSRDWFWLAAIAAGCSAVMLPMLLSGVPEGYDILDHLSFASSYQDAMLKGHLLVRWAGPDNFGFGSIGTRFYPPLSDLLTGVVNIFTNDWYNSFLISAFVWMLPGSIGIYLWAREFFWRPRSAGAAILFAVMPYHVFEIYQYTFVSEFAAAAILPFCFWSITRLIRCGRVVDILFFTTSISLLILTHLPTIITGGIALGIYGLFLIEWKNVGKVVNHLAIAGCAALAATAFYWVRMVSELGFVMHNGSEDVSGAQAFSYHLFPIYFTARPEFYQLKMLWLLDDNTILTLLILLPGVLCVLLKLHRSFADIRARKLFLGLVCSGVVLMFMASAPSRFIWEHAPALSKIQFPWRFLSPASVVAPLSFAVAIPLLVSHFSRFKRLIVYSAVLLLAAVLIYDTGDVILASSPNSREVFAERFGTLHDRKACECWWPVGANEYAFDDREKVESHRANSITFWEPEERQMNFAAGDPELIRIATFWYPYWKATINNLPAEVHKDGNGVILIQLPAEAVDLRLYFEEPVMLVWAGYVSLAAWLMILFASVFVIWRGNGALQTSADKTPGPA